MHHGIGHMVQYPFWILDLTLGPTPSPLDIRPWDLLPLSWTSDLDTYSLSLDIRPGDLLPLSCTSDLGTYSLSPGHQTWGPTPSLLDIRPGDLLPLPWTSDLGTYSLSLDTRPGDLPHPLLWTVRRACENMTFPQLHLRALLPLLGRSDAPVKTWPSRNFTCGPYSPSLDSRTRLRKHDLPATSLAGPTPSLDSRTRLRKHLPSRNFICGPYFPSLGYQTRGPTPIPLTVDRQTRLWKHYLPATSFAGGKESNWRYQ